MTHWTTPLIGALAASILFILVINVASGIAAQIEERTTHHIHQSIKER